MSSDHAPFRNHHSPEEHKDCRDPLCITCLEAEYAMMKRERLADDLVIEFRMKRGLTQ